MFRHVLQYGLLLVIALIARLPHILNDHFVLDGDEAIVGLMLQSLLEGNGFDAFFWGQNYGLVLPELLASLPFALFFGIDEFVLKTPQLLWFCLGVYFIFLTISKTSSTQLAWLVAILCVTCSTWFLWGMRARGGYGFAFAVAHFVIYMVATKIRWKTKDWVILGICIGGVFTAQTLWFPAAVIFGLAALIKSGKHVVDWMWTSIGIVVGMLPWIVHFQSEVYHQPSTISFDWSVIAFNSTIIYSFFERAFNGLYLQGSAFQGLTSVNLYSIVMCAIMLFVPLGLGSSIRKNPMNMLLWAALLSILSMVFGSLLLSTAAPRYALPLFGYLMIGICFIQSVKWVETTRLIALSGLLILSLTASIKSSVISYEDFTRQQMSELLIDLSEHDVNQVFVGNYMFQWQIMFYSNMEILARSKQSIDRVPAIHDQANLRYQTDPSRSAIVDFSWELGPQVKDNDRCGEVFCVHYNPTIEDLKKQGFADF